MRPQVFRVDLLRANDVPVRGVLKLTARVDTARRVWHKATLTITGDGAIGSPIPSTSIRYTPEQSTKIREYLLRRLPDVRECVRRFRERRTDLRGRAVVVYCHRSGGMTARPSTEK